MSSGFFRPPNRDFGSSFAAGGFIGGDLLFPALFVVDVVDVEDADDLSRDVVEAFVVTTAFGWTDLRVVMVVAASLFSF